MLFDVAHNFSLFVTYIEGSGGTITRRSQIGIQAIVFVGGVDIADALVEDNPTFSTHQLQHENEKQNFGVYLSVLTFYDPPQLLIVHVEKLLHELLMSLQGQLRASVEVRGQVQQLGDCVPSWWEEKILEAVGEG